MGGICVRLLYIIALLVILAFTNGLCNVFKGIKDKDVGGTGNDAGVVAFAIISEVILSIILIIKIIHLEAILSIL